MGLDIVAYSRLKKNEFLSAMSIEDKEYILVDYLSMPSLLAEIEEVFPGMAEPLEYNDDVYDCENYKIYNIGSYGTYNWFRQELDTFSKDRRDFNELLTFSDCEGTIGSVVSGKLYKDFSSNAKQFEKWVHHNYPFSDGELLLQMYYKFESAFEIAKDGGAVDFC